MLAAQERAHVSANELKVTGPTTAAVVHEDTLLLVVGRLGVHGELDVLQRGSLSDLPVNASTSTFGHACEVDLHIANLAEEVVLVGPPVAACAVIGVCIEHSHACEVGGSGDDRAIQSITDELSVVVHLNWRRDFVCTLGEVHDGRSDSGRVAPGIVATTSNGGTVRLADGLVDGGGVVSVTIADGSVILDVAENLIVVVVAPDCALTLDVLHPKGRSGLARFKRCRSSRNKRGC